jgi:hypothetical protein
VRRSTGDFLSAATRNLAPQTSMRDLEFDRAIQIPVLPRNLHGMSTKYRDQIINQFDSQIRWRAWREL